MSKTNHKNRYSFKIHYITIAATSIFFTLLQLSTYYLFGVKEETPKNIFESIGYVAIFLNCLLVIEAYALPFNLVNNKINFKQFLTHIIIFLIAISFQYAILYNTIFILAPKSFAGINESNYLYSLFDFLYYSIGILSGNSLSKITAVTFYGKLASMSESLLFFYLIIILLSNYREVGKSKIGSKIDILTGNEKI